MARSKIDVESIGWSEQIKENVSISGSFTVEGQTSIPSSKKVNQKAISLDGVDDRIVVGDYDEFTFSNASGDLPFSISAWIYVNDVSTDIGTIVGKFTFSSPGNEWMFKQELGYLHFYMYDFDKSGTGDQKRIIASSATVTSNTWHHVVVTCDGGSGSPGYTLYTDASTTAGTQQFTNNYEQTRNTSAPLTIGAADLGSGNRIFEDKIADIVIFNKELSSAEVTELYNSGNVKDVRTHSAYDNVVSWWKMGDDLDSTSTDGIIDYVSGYHGTVENGASIVSETTLGSDNVGPISITRSGSLGVGIESPESTLHVAGRTIIDGDLIVSSNTTLEAPVTLNRDLVVTGSTTVQNLIIDTAVVGNLTVSGSQLKLTSAGPTSLFLEADTDNTTETDTAFIKMSQDGGAVTSYVGLNPANDKDPENNDYTDAVSNALIITNNYSNGVIQFGTSNSTKLTIDAAGDLGIGTNAPRCPLHVARTLSGETFSNANLSGLLIESAGSSNAYFALQVATIGGGKFFSATNAGRVGIGTTTPETELHLNGGLTLTEKSSDPSDPAEGNSVLWMSDGTGSGDDGDIMMKITAGGVTKTITLVDFSAS